tara:strand:+ start:5758 stop:6564 length:807 start_codon:yes stop_codon:yes gene_type:complete
MSKQRVVKDEIWDDDWFYELDSLSKLTWVFLLTNPRGNIAGIYKLNKKWASQATGIDLEKLNDIFLRFVNDGKIIDDSGWIGLVNFHKHLAYRNASVAQGIVRLYREGTGCPQSVHSVWVTLLNSTLLNLSDSEEKSSQLKKEIKEIIMGWKSHNENNHTDDVPSIDLDTREEVKKPEKVKRHYKEVYQIFKEELGESPADWIVNPTEQKAGDNLFTEKGEKKIRTALRYFKENKDNEFCPQIYSPSSLMRKWKPLALFITKLNKNNE